MPLLAAKNPKHAKLIPHEDILPLLGYQPPSPALRQAHDIAVRRMGKMTAAQREEFARKEKEKQGYAWWQWLLLLAFGLIFGLANGADNAASSIRALPAMIHLSTGWFQFVISTLSVLGAIMNFMVIMMAFPMLMSFLKEKFLTGGVNKRGSLWELSATKKTFIGIGFIFTLATSVGIAFFTFESVPTVIIGIAAAFGLTVSSGGTILALAAALAVIQGVSMFLMLFKDTINIISNANKDSLKKFLMIGEYKPRTTQEHFIRVGRLFMNLIGAGILLLAGAFMIFGQAAATYHTLLDWEWSATAAKIFTGVFVYCIATLSHFALRVCSANGVFGKFGDWLGKKIGYVFSSNEEKYLIDRENARNNANKVEKTWSEKSVPEKVQTVLRFIWPITLLSLIGNTIGNAFSGMRGDHLLHEGTSTAHSAFHHEADAIAKNPGYVYDAKPVGAGAPEIASAAINGAASATLVTYFVFACDLGGDKKQSRYTSRFDDQNSSKAGNNPVTLYSRHNRNRVARRLLDIEHFANTDFTKTAISPAV